MSEGDIWISHFFSDSTYVRSGIIDWTAPGWREVAQRLSPPPETLPLPIYADLKGEPYKSLPPVFQGPGGIHVCPALAEVFQRFVLVEGGPGKGGVFPTQLYLYDRTTPARSDYSVLVYGGKKKHGLIPELSKGLTAGKYTTVPPARWMLSTIKDGDIAVRASARSGADLWFDDKLQSGVFMSDRLVQALKDAGFAKHFKFKRCRVIEAD